MSNSVSGREERLREHERSKNRETTGERRPRYPQDYRDRSRERRPYDKQSRPVTKYHEYKKYGREQERTYDAEKKDEPQIIKQKPSFEPSGLLAKESNNIEGVQLKYTEPEDKAVPLVNKYHLYSFKKDSTIPKVYDLDTKSHFLIGRETKVVQIQTDHETCSKQHAVIQFRSRPVIDESGKTTAQIKPYIIDLESSNGTFINNQEIPTSRFIELKPEDVIRFGESTTDNVFILS